ncbi:hypothetical protein NX059_009629 [Plenodomus lindquistii]|nr:hypothetical protein NX059_009629 [Plenodomus lindquistii]
MEGMIPERAHLCSASGAEAGGGNTVLVSPGVLKAEISMNDASTRTVATSRVEAADIIHTRDDRLLVIVGPCSIHDPIAALEYGQLVKEARARFSADLCIVMRAYVEKPRTTVGWKGLLMDPDLDGSYNVEKGLRMSRQLYAALTRLGVPIASELLEPLSPAYLGDFVSVGAIGARTTESQPHRQLASSMPFPVGFKNGTDGGISAAINSLNSAATPHTFPGGVTDAGLAAVVRSSGNPNCFVVLRGGTSGPNYETGHIVATQAMLTKSGHRTGIVVDCSHGNSNKNYRLQTLAVRNISGQLQAGQRSIVGVMIESNLNDGQQVVSKEGPIGLEKGVSITDGCIGWSATVECLEQLAEAVQKRRECVDRLID